MVLLYSCLPLPHDLHRVASNQENGKRQVRMSRNYEFCNPGGVYFVSKNG